MRAHDDLAAVSLALHLDAEPLSVFDFGRDRRVQRNGGAVVHAVALVPAHRPETVRRDLGAVLEERGTREGNMVKLNADYRHRERVQISQVMKRPVGRVGLAVIYIYVLRVFVRGRARAGPFLTRYS